MNSSLHPLQTIGALVDTVACWNPTRDGGDEEQIRYIDIGSVDGATKEVDCAEPIPARGAPSRARQLVRAGDVLVSTVRPNLNSVAQVPRALDGATASTGFCVLRPLPTALDGRYLFHWVRSTGFVSEMVRRATGASYPAVSDRIVMDSRMPLAALEAQRRIAAVLDQADALRAKRRRALALLDTLAQSIFLDLFGDPATNSKGWPETKLLGEVADIASGVTKGRRLDGKPAREVPYLAVSNVQDRALDLSTVKSIPATEDEIQRYRLMANDLLLTEGGDPDKLGRGTLWDDELPECIHQNHIFRVRITNGEITPLFLNWLVGSQRGKRYFLRSAKQTTGIASINMTQLRGFPLVLPPLDLQHAFAAQISAVDRLKSAHQSSLAKLGELFASLQHRAFRGEL